MFERLWVYMGYTVHALASSTGDGLYCVQRISLQRSAADVRIDIRPLPDENAPQSRPEDALNALCRSLQLAELGESHIRKIYEIFCVRSRAELSALFIKKPQAGTGGTAKLRVPTDH